MKEKFEKKLKLMKEALFVRGTNRVKCYPRIFFTADTHFGSERTLQLSRRPYKNTQQMDEALIRNWNATIKDTDHVYHLGDFGHYSNIKHLNGKVHLLMGNYERKDFLKILSQCNNCQEKAKIPTSITLWSSVSQRLLTRIMPSSSALIMENL